jgi:hypothetical protein
MHIKVLTDITALSASGRVPDRVRRVLDSAYEASSHARQADKHL